MLFLAVFIFLQIQAYDSLIVKWILPNAFIGDSNYIELKQPLLNKEDTCKWYKLNDNREIDEGGNFFENQFVYKQTSKECNLLVMSYDKKSHTELDFYKAVIFSSKLYKEQPTYALAYYHSFNLNKRQVNATAAEYKCELVFTFPDTVHVSLLDEINNALASTILISNGQPDSNLPTSKATTYKSQPFNRRLRRAAVNKTRYVVNYTIADSVVIDNRYLKNTNDYQCNLTLLEGSSKKLVFQKFLKLPVVTTAVKPATATSTTPTKGTVLGRGAMPSNTTKFQISKNIDNWSEHQVASWLVQSRFDQRIIDMLKKLDGKQLKRLKMLWKEAPNYFYETLSQHNRIDLHAMLHFIEEFEKLSA